MPPRRSGRDRSLRVIVSDHEMGMLQALADAQGVTVSDVVRMGLRDIYLERFGFKPVVPHPKSPRRKTG